MNHDRARFLLLALMLTASTARADDAIEKALAQPILGHRQTLAEVQEFCAIRVPKMPHVDTPEQWRKQVEFYRNDVSTKVAFRGEAARWRALPTNVVWLDTIDGGPGYRIKKLRYEAVPGVWVPALLYEPEKLAGRVPVVLNVNGHDPNGKAADYKQIRCINQAKRGMLALNVEWFGMGQLKGDGYRHGLINAIDLCGTSGIAVHLLMLQRGIDVLLTHANADPERVAVTGLSGGGWQTSFVSGLDPRVTLADPVAGYSSFATRVRYLEDLGDSEQTPCDLGLVVDYTHLTAMRAPKPTLLTFNAKDNCCFAADHAMPPLVEAATPLYKLFGAEANLRTHVNHDPGDHNYGHDNRLAFYRMVGDNFYAGDASYPREELPYEGELKTAEQLHVELPSDNLDFAKLASRLAEPLPRNAEIPKVEAALARWQAEARLRLLGIVRPFDPHTAATKLEVVEKEGLSITRWQLRVGAAWTVPAVEFSREKPMGTTLLLCDEGRAKAGDTVAKLLSEGQRVVAIDPFYFGESKINEHDYLFALLVAALGERPLGVQAGQVMAAARWMKARDDLGRIRVNAVGPRTSVIARVAAALEPKAIGAVDVEKPLDSLKSLVERHADYPESPELFCFGLLEAFDMPQLEALNSKSR
jgi:hypothetical protein